MEPTESNIEQTGKELEHTVAAAAFETPGASGLLVRQFGVANARALMNESRGAVAKLYKAYRAVSIAIKGWNGSPQSAVRIAQSTLAYQERMLEVAAILGVRTLELLPKHRAVLERRRERAAYHRGRGSDDTLPSLSKARSTSPK